ncbi:MAG: SGNH/GDSL hydrolase family protein, partial [Gemmataceae bacterium]|nr:SGNH/GDSL hydrolase family protein [Gemmataceae bacterium]
PSARGTPPMLLSVACALLVGAQPTPTPFALKDGDRVVWVGGTLVEREQRYGYWEAALVAANPDKNITFRNLGWSGDTVHGESRGRFDFANADKCFKQLVEPVLELKPTVVFISYGANEAFEGKDGLPNFEKGMAKLLDALKPTGARIVLFTPAPVEKNQSLPDPKPVNDKLELYAQAVRDIAKQRGLAVVDVFSDFQGRYGNERLTENGLHLGEAGYKALATRFAGLVTPGASAPDWDKLDPLRKAVVAKNEQFFNKWRPQNETYLFGFRKHEQGRNAKEVAEFDPFIAKAEEEIARLRKELKK